MVCFPIFGFGLALASAAQFALANHVVPELPQSFLFDWNDVTQPVPVPTTAQCDTIQIKWSRSTATGPNPTAPYYLQIYTSTSTFPFIVSAGPGLAYNLTIPFAPSTQYQICMFDAYGNTGGCQAVYTVYPAPNTTAANPPTCTNITYPTATLDVVGTVINGPLSQYGWVDQCTDLTLTPKNGTPPYTMTVAPALHPPYNITSNTQGPLTWTVSLSHASPFFVSLVDSTGLAWANGPLHSGGGGSTGCLALSAGSKVATPVAIGSAVGGLALGAILAILFMALFNRRKYGKLHPHSSRSSLDASPIAAPSSARFGMITPLDTAINRPPGTSNTVGQYEIEPFSMPSDPPRAPASNPSAASDSQSDPSSGPPQRSHVYVVHHDGGRAPVTVYADGDADIVELPPTYARQDNSGQPPFRTQRRPGPSPRKASNPSTSNPSVS